MSKYHPLNEYLSSIDGNYLKSSYKQVEKIISDKLPPSAFKYREWWANGGHIQANAWLEANWKVKRVILGEYVEFVK